MSTADVDVSRTEVQGCETFLQYSYSFETGKAMLR